MPETQALWAEGLCPATVPDRGLGLQTHRFSRVTSKVIECNCQGDARPLCEIPMSHSLCFQLSEGWDSPPGSAGPSGTFLLRGSLLAFHPSGPSALPTRE